MRWFNTLTALFPILAVAGGALLLLFWEALAGRETVPAAGDIEALYRARIRSALRSTFAVGVLVLAAVDSLNL